MLTAFVIWTYDFGESRVIVIIGSDPELGPMQLLPC